MTISTTYPGVYVQELPSSVHTITGVSTSVAAFLGYFSQGPMNTPTQIFGLAEFERTFGALIATSEAGYGIQQFFANGGSEAWVVRVAAATPAVAAKAATPAVPAQAAVPATGTTPAIPAVPAQPAAPAVAAVPAGPVAASTTIPTQHSVGAPLTATATSEGGWGDGIRLAVDYNTSAPGASFNLTVTQVDSSSPPVAVTTELHRNLTLNPTDPNYALSVVNARSNLVQLKFASAPPTGNTDLPEPNGTVGSPVTNSILATAVGSTEMTVTFGTQAPFVVSLTSLSGPEPTLIDLAGTIQSMLQAGGPSPTSSTMTEPGVPTAVVSLVPTATAGSYQLQITANSSNPAVDFQFSGALAALLGIDTADATTDDASNNVQLYALGSGLDGDPPGASDLIGDPAHRTGIYALDTVDQFNLLCLPDVMNLPDSAAAAVISAAETYCGGHWAFLLVDVPQSSAGGTGGSQRDSVSGIQDWMAQNATLRSSYAAMYYPRPQIPDPLNGYRLRAVAPSGTIAGLFAQTDGTRGVWKAPAGTAATLTNVPSLTYKMTDAENGVLNPLGINCLRSLPVYGNVCWGTRTLVGADQLASQWKYIPVRRLALYIEASLFQGTQWVVFEPNDEPLWSQIRLNVGTFMQTLFLKGAFQGSTPASAYFVKCDSATTTQADINLGVVNIIVGFAPLEPAEFVVLQIQQIVGQSPS